MNPTAPSFRFARSTAPMAAALLTLTWGADAGMAADPAGPGDSLTIRAIAPAKSFFLLTADDLRGTIERFRKTPLHALWKTDRVQTAVGEEWREFQTAQSKRLQELGLPEDTLSWPVNAGLAAYLDRNEELDTLEPVIVAMFDWGDGAEKMAAYFDANAADYARSSPERVTTREIRGRKATVIAVPAPAQAPPGAFGGMGNAAMPKIESLVYVRDGSRFLFTTGVYAMEDALAAIDVPPKSLVTDADDAREALAQLGSGDVLAILRTGPLAPLVDEAAVGAAAMVMPMLGQLFGDIQAYGFSGSVDGSIGMLDGAITMLVPGEKKGVLSLLGSSAAGPAPAVVPQDAIGYGRFNFAFSGLMRVIEGVVAGLPEFIAQEVEAPLQMYGPTLRQAFAALGPDIHVATTVSQPITEESESNTILIACSDEKAVVPLINMFAPMVGFESRDFLGQTIFSSNDMEMAIGFGGKYMIVGRTSNVEQALRAAAQPAAAGGSRPEAEQVALSVLPSRPMVSWGWYDTVAGLEVSRQLALASGSRMTEFADFIDEQGRAVVEVLGVEKVPTKLIDSIRAMDSEFLSQYIGPQIWEFTSDSKGFAYRFSLLRPKPATSR